MKNKKSLPFMLATIKLQGWPQK